MDTLRHDLRHAVRFLTRQPGWTLVVCLTLALGIGATTAIFSLVDAVLLRPLDFADPDRLAVVWESKLEDAATSRVSPPTFLDWRESEAFEDLAAVAEGSLVVGGETARSVAARTVTPGFFRILGVRPALGRAFSPDEAVPGNEHVVVVSHGFWQRRLGGRADAVGRPIELSEETYTVIGVLPAGFHLYEPADLFTPLAFAPDRLTEGMRGARYLRVVGRLADGVSWDRAREALNALAGRLAADHPILDGWGVTLRPWHEELVGSSRLALLLLFGVVAFVLLIACANVANLLLARTAARRREMAVRGALGAGRGRLLAQLMTESLVVAFVGGSAGLLLASWWVDMIGLVPWPIPRLGEVAVDGRSIAFAALLSVITGLVTGLAPALAGSRSRIAGALREAGAAALGGGGRLRSALIVAETALALVVLIGAGLLLRSYVSLQAVDPGFRAAGTVSAFVSLPEARYGDESQRRSFVVEVLERLGAASEVGSAAATTNLPISGMNMTFGFFLPDRPQGESEPDRVAEYHAVSPDYFRTMGIPLLRGRAFSDSDRADAPPVVVINRATAETYFPGENPLGRRLATHYDGEEREIVGVVGSVRHFGLDSAPRPEVYVPWEQNPWQFLRLAVHGSGGETAALPAVIRGAVAAIDPRLPVDVINDVEEQVRASLAPLRFQALLVGLFGVVGLLLTLLGLYGVISYSLTRRTQEVAVRMALGARKGDVAWQFLRQGLGLTLCGLAVGTAAALGLTRLLAGFLYGVGARDPWTFAAAAFTFGLVAFLACLRPALRAAGLEPMAALRCD